MDFRLPDIGEGIHEGEIVKWLVKEGDLVSEDQPLVEVMTDKATVEIPSPAKGKVQKIHVQAGQVVQVESVLVTIAEEGERHPERSEGSRHPEVRSTEGSRHSEQSGHPEQFEVPHGHFDEGSPRFIPQPIPTSGGPVLATPVIRKLAKDLGVDLAKIKGSGPEGRITEADIKKQTERSGHPEVRSTEGSPCFTPQPIQKLGPEERLPLKGIRKIIAHHLQLSKHFAPHYSYVEEVDFTDLVHLQEAQKKEAEKQSVKLTYLSYVVKALIPVLKEFPYLNASLDETTQEIVLKKYYTIGVAVSTPDGLVVPVVKDADKKSLFEVAKEIVRLSDAVRTNKAKPEELKGSTFTVTSIGSIGGVFATPILNYPEVAILGVNKIVERPMVRDGKIIPRHMMYLSLTLDHRVVDGAVAAHFMNKLVSVLQNPKTIL